jgi:hypothetical protein
MSEARTYREFLQKVGKLDSRVAFPDSFVPCTPQGPVGSGNVGDAGLGAETGPARARRRERRPGAISCNFVSSRVICSELVDAAG